MYIVYYFSDIDKLLILLLLHINIPYNELKNMIHISIIIYLELSFCTNKKFEDIRDVFTTS